MRLEGESTCHLGLISTLSPMHHGSSYVETLRDPRRRKRVEERRHHTPPQLSGGIVIGRHRSNAGADAA